MSIPRRGPRKPNNPHHVEVPTVDVLFMHYGRAVYERVEADRRAEHTRGVEADCLLDLDRYTGGHVGGRIKVAP